MANKYPGTCKCGARVARGAGDCRKVDGRWVVVCGDCDTGDGSSVRVNTVRFGNQTFYRNARGRCEDAPCCGCCTI